MVTKKFARFGSMKRAAVATLAFALSSCGGGDAGGLEHSFSTRSASVEIDGDVVRMDVSIPVFLLGFDSATQTQLQALLPPMLVDANSGLLPTAIFDIQRPDAVWQAKFDAFLATTRLDGHADLTGFDGPVLDGNAIEAWLDTHLGDIADVPDGLTSLVILNTGLSGHAYHYAGNVGWREPVRTFGEATSLLVWDPHAEPDPWVGTAEAHHVPVSKATPELIAEWTKRAVAIRALHAPSRTPAIQSCHAVTVVLAVRNTALTPDLLGLQSWEDTLDIPALEATYEKLVDDEVYFDLLVRQLPLEDPVLDVLTRENNARVVTATYLDLNFDSYHVAHEGCEPYLSLVVFGDLLDQRTSSNGNAQTSLINGRRISTSLVAENVRIMSELVGYNEAWDESTSFERVGPGADPLEWFNWVIAHETGHLFSLPHPNAGTGDGESYSDTGFASTWNAMGYQMRRIVTEMSMVDANNFARNQAAAAVLAATDDNARKAALEAMADYRWKAAVRLATMD